MSLLLVYLAIIAIGQSATIAIALTVERLVSPATSVLVFIGLYFTVFWLGWVLAVWLTVPGKRLGALLSKTPPAEVRGG
jgi:TctA family transporter